MLGVHTAAVDGGRLVGVPMDVQDGIYQGCIYLKEERIERASLLTLTLGREG